MSVDPFEVDDYSHLVGFRETAEIARIQLYD